MTADGAARMRAPRAIVATVVFIEFGAAAHRIGVGVPVQVIPKLVVAVLVAPMAWQLLRYTASVPRALLAASGAQVILHLALAGMEPSSGGSAAPAHLHQDLPVLRIEGGGQVAGAQLSVSLIQAHVVAVLSTCVMVLVADDVLRAVTRSHDSVTASPDETTAPGEPQPHATAWPRRLRRSGSLFVVPSPPGASRISGHPGVPRYTVTATRPPHVRRPPPPR